MTNDEMQKILEENENLVRFTLCKHFPAYMFDDDMFQVGMIALWKAASTFDFSRGKFSTYAVKCIKNGINCELRKVNRRIAAGELSLTDVKSDGDDDDWRAEKFVYKAIDNERRVEDKVILNEALRSLESTLTENQKKCFYQYVHSVNGEQAARNLGISRGSLSTTVSRIRKKLLNSLKNGEVKHEYSKQ